MLKVAIIKGLSYYEETIFDLNPIFIRSTLPISKDGFPCDNSDRLNHVQKLPSLFFVSPIIASVYGRKTSFYMLGYINLCLSS